MTSGTVFLTSSNPSCGVFATKHSNPAFLKLNWNILDSDTSSSIKTIKGVLTEKELSTFFLAPNVL